MLLSQTQTGVADVTNENYEVKIISWLAAMRNVDWLMWKEVMRQIK
jgi:hypothetical protein